MAAISQVIQPPRKHMFCIFTLYWTRTHGPSSLPFCCCTASGIAEFISYVRLLQKWNFRHAKGYPLAGSQLTVPTSRFLDPEHAINPLAKSAKSLKLLLQAASAKWQAQQQQKQEQDQGAGGRWQVAQGKPPELLAALCFECQLA